MGEMGSPEASDSDMWVQKRGSVVVMNRQSEQMEEREVTYDSSDVVWGRAAML